MNQVRGINITVFVVGPHVCSTEYQAEEHAYLAMKIKETKSPFTFSGSSSSSS